METILEIDLIEEHPARGEELAEDLNGWLVPERNIRDRKPGDSLELVWIKKRRIPGDRRAPVMTNDYSRPIGLKRSRDPCNVTRDRFHVIGFDGKHIDREQFLG